MTAAYYSSRETLDPDFPCKILRYTDRSMKQTLHTHEYVQIAYTRRGMCHHRMRGKSLHVGQGDLFIITPGVEHSLSGLENQEFELVLLDFMPFVVRDALRSFSETLYAFLGEPQRTDGHADPPEYQPWLHIPKTKQTLVESLLQDIQDECDNREPGYEYAVRISLIKLLILIDRECRKRMPRAVYPSMPGERHPIEEARRFVYDNYSQDIPLEQGAYVARMAPAYFSHRFRKETGQTFVDFVNEVRIEQAKERIRRNAQTISQIGFQVGFRHVGHFIRTFKKRTGITPSEYKKTFSHS